MSDQDNGAVGSAVMPEFADAIGLDELLAGKESPRPRPAAGQPFDKTTETAAPAAATTPSWPPPPTPEPFKTIIVQLDTLISMLGKVERCDDKMTAGVADSVWPVAYYYGAGSNERPSPFMLVTMAGLSVLAFVTTKVLQIRAAREAAQLRATRDRGTAAVSRPAGATPAPSDGGRAGE